MKNPFEKKDNKVMIAGMAIGCIAAGTAAYLFLTENGSQLRQQFAGRFTRFKDQFLGKSSESQHTTEPAYLHHTVKKPKTDRERLLKHGILHNPATEHGEQ